MLCKSFRQASRLGVMTLGLLALACFGDAQPDKEKPKTDQAGDPLPANALARMGSMRWRHGEVVSFVAFTGDGKGVLTAAFDSTIRLWDRETGKEIRRFDVAKQAQPGGLPAAALAWNVYGRGASKIAVSNDGKTLAVVLMNNSIQLFDITTGKELRQIKSATPQIMSILFAPDGKSLAARGNDRTIHLLSTDTGNEIRQIKRAVPADGKGRVFFGGIAEGIAFSPDGKIIASSGMEIENQKVAYSLRLFETESGKETRAIEITPGGASAVAFSPDGKFFAYGTNNAVHLRDADGGKEVRKIDRPNGAISLAFSPDSKTFAVKGRDQVLSLHETETGKQTHQLGAAAVAPNGNVMFVSVALQASRDFAFSNDGKTIAAGGAQLVRFWNVADGKEQAASGGHRGAVSAVVVSPDGKTLLSRGADNFIRRWDAESGKELGQFAEPKGTLGAVFAPDGKTVALVNADGTIRVHTIADGKELHSLKGHANGVAALTFAPDSKTLASRGNSDNTIRLYDVVKGGELKQITLPGADPAAGGGFVVVRGGYGAPGQSLAFSPDGQSLAGNININANGMIRGPGGVPQPNASNTLHVWDVLTGKEVRKITLPPNRNIVNLAYSPDGRVLAAENSDQTVSLWELASGKERGVLGSAPAVAQPGGQPVFIGGGGFGVAGRFNTPLAATTVTFSPDGALIATRYTDQTVRVFEVASRKEVGSFKGHEGAVQAIAFAPSGKTIASASADTTLLVWDLAGLKRTPKAAGVDLAAKDVEALWADLLADDAERAAAGIAKLSSAPKQAAAFMSEKLKPATPPDAKMIDQWIHDLDSANFAKRTKASGELEKLGELAVPALKKTLTSQPTPEVRRRVEPILEKLTTGILSGEQIRTVRAVEALESIGSEEARAVLQALAKGAPGALSTRHAQAALDRLAR